MSHTSKHKFIHSFFWKNSWLDNLLLKLTDTKIAKKKPNKITLDLDTRSSTCSTRGQRVLRKLNCFKNEPQTKSRPVYFSEFF